MMHDFSFIMLFILKLKTTVCADRFFLFKDITCRSTCQEKL